MKMTPFLEHIVYDIFGEEHPITFRAMMGAHILYYEGMTFAIVEGEELYFKGSEELGSWYLSHPESKQFMYTRAGEDTYLYYFLVPLALYENVENKEIFYEWLHVALSVAKPPKPRKKKLVR